MHLKAEESGDTQPQQLLMEPEGAPQMPAQGPVRHHLAFGESAFVVFLLVNAVLLSRDCSSELPPAGVLQAPSCDPRVGSRPYYVK